MTSYWRFWWYLDKYEYLDILFFTSCIKCRKIYYFVSWTNLLWTFKPFYLIQFLQLTSCSKMYNVQFKSIILWADFKQKRNIMQAISILLSWTFERCFSVGQRSLGKRSRQTISFMLSAASININFKILNLFSL